MLGFLVNGISMLFETRRHNLNDDIAESSAVSTDVIAPDETASESIGTKKFLLKIQDGIVVVYEADNINRPLFVTDIYAGTLRNYDRELLTEGITVDGEYKLQSIIEDFSS